MELKQTEQVNVSFYFLFVLVQRNRAVDEIRLGKITLCANISLCGKLHY